MLSGETVVGGVELRDAELDDDMSVGSLLVKLDSQSSEPSSVITGAAPMAAIVATVAVGWCANEVWLGLCKMAGQQNAGMQTRVGWTSQLQFSARRGGWS
jgi:hypothetical protein